MLQSMGSPRVRHNLVTEHQYSNTSHGEGHCRLQSIGQGRSLFGKIILMEGKLELSDYIYIFNSWVLMKWKEVFMLLSFFSKKYLTALAYRSSWQCVGSLVAAHRLSNCSMRAQLPHSMWDLSYLTRDRTRVPCIARQIINSWTTREVPVLFSC